jgi:hypothetical protein
MRYVVLGLVLLFIQALIISKVFDEDIENSMILSFWLGVFYLIVWFTISFW